MKVFTARSEKLFSVVRILVYGLRIIGLAPLAISAERTPRINPRDYCIRAFRSSKIGLAYNSLLLILVSVWAGYTLPSMFSTHVPSEFPISGAIFIRCATDISAAILRILGACMIISCWGLRQVNAASVTNRLLEVDARLSVLKPQPFDKRALIFLILHVCLNVLLWITFWSEELVFTSFYHFAVSCIRNLPLHIVYWFTVEYFTVVGLLARDLRSVNEYFENFAELGAYLSRPPVRSDRLAFEHFLTHRGDQLSSLQLLRKVRTTLFELCGDIATFFSFPIIFCIAHSFISICPHLYSVVETIRGANGHKSPAKTAHCALTYIFLLAYPVASLACNVTQTGEEAQRTGPIVNKLLAAARKGSKVRKELKEFSHQLLHENVDFTACKFFSLDATLLMSFLGGTIAYVIVLMQFETSYEGG